MKMKGIICNKEYDTEKSVLIGFHEYSSKGKFNYLKENLYKDSQGEYFLAVEGSSYDTIIPLDEERALKWAKYSLAAEELYLFN